MSCGGRGSCQQLQGQAVNHTEGATFRERKAERGGTETQPHSSRSQIRCSRELLENEELHGPDQITL